MEEILSKLDALLQLGFPANVQGTLNTSLLWIGFAYLIGLITSVLIPFGRWRQSPFSVLLVGLTGSCVGFLTISLWRNLDDFNPFSPAGFSISLVTSILALFLYRLTTLIFTGKKKSSAQDGESQKSGK